MLKRIQRFIISALIIAGVAFVAFGSGDPPPDVPSDFTTVTYWEKWTGAEGAQMQQIVDEFNKTVGVEKKIYVQYLAMTNIDQKTLVSVSAGVPPDIAGIWDQQIAQYAALGAIAPLDELAASHGIDGNTYLPVYWDACHFNGKLYSLISCPAVTAMVYNKVIFSENADALRNAGLDPTRPPRTIEELDHYAAVLDTRTVDGQIDRAGFIPTQSFYTHLSGFWFGDGVFDAKAQRFTIDSPQSIAAFKWIKSYSDRLGNRAVQDFTNAHTTSSFDTPQNPLLTGTLAMQQHGPWVADYFRRLAPHLSQMKVPWARESELKDRTENYAWAIAPFPTGPGLEAGGTAYCTFDALVIPTGARHKKEAFEFLAYVSRQDVAEKLDGLHCTNSPLRNVSEAFFKTHENPYIRVYQDLAASAGAHGVPSTPIWPEAVKELNDAVQAVSVQGADPETVLKGAQARLQGKLERFNEVQSRRSNGVASR